MKLYDLKARFYDAKIARFMQEDTYLGSQNDPLSLNLYTYVKNNPLTYWDPTGHMEAGDYEKFKNDPARLMELEALTNAYYAAQTQKEKDKIHEQAVAVRNGAPLSGDYTYTLTDQRAVQDALNLAQNFAALTNGGTQSVATGDYWGLIYDDKGKETSSITVNVNYANTLTTIATNTMTTFGDRTAVVVGSSWDLMANTASASLNTAFMLYDIQEAVFVSNMAQLNVGLQESLILLDYMNANQRSELTSAQVGKLLPHMNLPKNNTLAAAVEMAYKTAMFEMTMADAERELQQIQQQKVQEFLYIMIWIVASSTKNYYASEARITDPKTPAEWVEYNIQQHGVTSWKSFESSTYYRAMSEAEYQAVLDTGYLRGGNPGKTYFTNTGYTSAATAQSKLSLEVTPQYMVEFKITNNPNVTGGTIVKPDFGQLGGGIEFVTTDLVQVQIINAQLLR